MGLCLSREEKIKRIEKFCQRNNIFLQNSIVMNLDPSSKGGFAFYDFSDFTGEARKDLLLFLEDSIKETVRNYGDAYLMKFCAYVRRSCKINDRGKTIIYTNMPERNLNKYKNSFSTSPGTYDQYILCHKLNTGKISERDYYEGRY